MNHHTEILENHHIYNIDKNIEEIFTGICKEKNHKKELEFFCKTHNKLCCVACISKIKRKGNGQHTDCNICNIEEIKEEKKNKLNENTKFLEEISNIIDKSINELKKIFQKTNEDKQKIKMDASKIFTKIRNIINEREDEILLEIDNKFDSLYFKEEIIKQSEKLPKKIKISLEKGKLINNDWENNDNLSFKINDCLEIENNIQSIKKINEKIQDCSSKTRVFKFFPENENKLDEFLKIIKTFGEIKEDILSDRLDFKFKPRKKLYYKQ